MEIGSAHALDFSCWLSVVSLVVLKVIKVIKVLKVMKFGRAAPLIIDPNKARPEAETKGTITGDGYPDLRQSIGELSP